MRPHGEALLDVRPTPVAVLGGVARRHSDHLMAGSLSLVFKDTEKHAPARIMNALGEMMIAHHPANVQILYANAAVRCRVVVGGLEVEVAPLAADLEMLARDVPARLAAAVTPLLAATHRALSVRQTLLPPAIVARILHHAALGVRQKDLQADI